MTLPEPDWTRAERHLRETREAYASIGTAGMFGLSVVLMPLTARYERGERTQELYDAIMETR